LLSRLRGQNQVVDIRSGDLSFNFSESFDFFKKALSLTLKDIPPFWHDVYENDKLRVLRQDNDQHMYCIFDVHENLKSKYPQVFEESRNKLSEDSAKEFLMMIAMYQIIARKEGGEKAYDFIKSIFQKVAVISMPALYQADDLEKCDGDTFDNFVKFNIAWFNAMNDEGTFKVSEIREEKDKLTIIVSECANCVYGNAYDCPEIAKLGCDHDLAGYPVIMDRMNGEFRRPHTLAKGDAFCDFTLYRKGTAPEYEVIDGRKVKWDVSFNK
jgi:hypothetical protein